MQKLTIEELLKDTIDELESDEISFKRKLELELLYGVLAHEGEFVTQHLFATFSEYSQQADYTLLSSGGAFMDYKYLGAIQVPALSKEELIKMGSKKYDNEIADLHIKMEKVKEKKQQLLALEDQSGN